MVIGISFANTCILSVSILDERVTTPEGALQTRSGEVSWISENEFVKPITQPSIVWFSWLSLIFVLLTALYNAYEYGCIQYELLRGRTLWIVVELTHLQNATKSLDERHLEKSIILTDWCLQYKGLQLGGKETAFSSVHSLVINMCPSQCWHFIFSSNTNCLSY